MLPKVSRTFEGIRHISPWLPFNQGIDSGRNQSRDCYRLHFGAHKKGSVCPERVCKNTRVSTGLSKLVSCWFMSFFRGLATYLNSGYNLFTKYQQDIPVYARQIWMKCDSPHTSETHHPLREDHRDPVFGRMSSSVFPQIFQDGNLHF